MFFRRFHILPLTLLLAATTAPSAVLAASLSPVHLRCEYRENPVGIDETVPRLSWQCVGEGRGLRQKAYQIRVAASREALKQGRGDLWDSGKVETDRSTQVIYRGRPLPSGTRCYWQVRLWDQGGKVSAYSKPAYWEMGLVKPGDWSAKWIGFPLPDQQVPFDLKGTPWVWYPEGNPLQNAPQGTRYFRRSVEIPADRPIRRARFYLAADNSFTLFVNGKAVGNGGGWGTAQEIDVQPQLVPGRNTFAVSATNADGPAGLLGKLVVQYDTGAPITLNIDSQWKAAEREHPGWQNAGFRDADWPAARQIGVMGTPPWGQVKAGGTEGGPSPYLRREFELTKPVRRARAYVTALGLYRLHLNGRRIGEDALSPGWTDYRKRALYQTFDITDQLNTGTNALGAIVGDGWFAGSLGFDLSRNHFGPGPARFRLQLHIEHTDGSERRVVTDENWLGATGPIRESDLYAGETYDARREMPGWDTPAYSPTLATWRAATVYTDRQPALNAQMEPPIRVTEELKTRYVLRPKPGVYVFDLGQNMVGRARLKAQGPAGTRVTLRFAEVLNPDGTVYRDNLRRARATDTYILRGGGPEVYEPHFTYHGFRYVEVTGYPGEPSADAITGRVFHTAATPTSRFTTSSDLINRLYRNIDWGLRGNLMSVPTDCPQRDERLGWMGDAQLFARSSIWYMDLSGFYTKWMRDIVDAQSAEGGFSDVSPRVVDLADGAPAWAEAGLVVPWTLYECYGDTRILERNWEPMRRYVDLLVQHNPDLLWLKRRNNDFGDWVPAGEQTNKDLIASAYLAYDLRLLSRMAAALGRGEEAKKYAELADRSAAAFNQRFLAADGRYTGDTQTAYAMALGLDLVPADRKAQVTQRLVEAVRRRNGHLATGFIGTRFLLPALSDGGHHELACSILGNRTYPSWGYMIEKGATTIWELWNSDTEGPAMNSRNHFAFGTVAEWLQRYLAGIDTDAAAPGYRRIIIRPRLHPHLTHARGEYDALQGPIVSEWTRKDDGLELVVRIPANTSAQVHLPRTSRGLPDVVEGGKPVWKEGRLVKGRPGIYSARGTEDGVVFEIGSGTYRFRTSRGSHVEP